MLEAQKKSNKEAVLQFQKNILLNSKKLEQINKKVKSLVKINNPDAETNDKDYIFMYYVINYLPHGLVGLIFAVMFSAAMSSTASELNALASTTTVDIYKRAINKTQEEHHYLQSSKYFTFFVGNISYYICHFCLLI